MVNLKRDPFEMGWGDEKKRVSGSRRARRTGHGLHMGWNLPIGQALQLANWRPTRRSRRCGIRRLQPDQILNQLKKGQTTEAIAMRATTMAPLRGARTTDERYASGAIVSETVACHAFGW
jgi:hypothetical protein